MNRHSNKTIEELQKEVDKISKLKSIEYYLKPERFLDSADVLEAFAYKLLEIADESRETYKRTAEDKKDMENQMKRLFGFDI